MEYHYRPMPEEMYAADTISIAFIQDIQDNCDDIINDESVMGAIDRLGAAEITDLYESKWFEPKKGPYDRNEIIRTTQQFLASSAIVRKKKN